MISIMSNEKWLPHFSCGKKNWSNNCLVEGGCIFNTGFFEQPIFKLLATFICKLEKCESFNFECEGLYKNFKAILIETRKPNQFDDYKNWLNWQNEKEKDFQMRHNYFFGNCDHEMFLQNFTKPQLNCFFFVLHDKTTNTSGEPWLWLKNLISWNTLFSLAFCSKTIWNRSVFRSKNLTTNRKLVCFIRFYFFVYVLA